MTSPVFGSPLRLQVCFVGPFGVGKTTAVQAVSQADVVLSEAPSTVAALSGGRHLKQSSTVGLEHGTWTTPGGSPVAVVGTPGQARFDDVRRSAVPRSTAVVLWLFGHHPEALLDCELWVRFMLEEGVPVAKLAVAVTRTGETSAAGLDDFRRVVGQVAHPDVPVVGADPRDRGDVGRAIEASLRGRHGAAVVGGGW